MRNPTTSMLPMEIIKYSIFCAAFGGKTKSKIHIQFAWFDYFRIYSSKPHKDICIEAKRGVPQLGFRGSYAIKPAASHFFCDARQATGTRTTSGEDNQTCTLTKFLCTCNECKGCFSLSIASPFSLGNKIPNSSLPTPCLGWLILLAAHFSWSRQCL